MDKKHHPSHTGGARAMGVPTQPVKMTIIDETAEWDVEKARQLGMSDLMRAQIEGKDFVPLSGPEFEPMSTFLGHDWEWHAKTLNRHSRRKLAKLHRQKKGKRT